MVEAFHPLVKQAKLLSEAAQQELRMGRGGFDPKANLEYNEKTFDKKNYYQLFDSYLKVPTWVGLDFVGGYERNTGLDLNSTENTANGKGIAYLGATLPIGAGLFIDQRRATLKQAEIGLQMAEAERLKAINKVVLQVAKDYWAWYEAYQTMKNISQGYAYAVQRFEGVRQKVVVGDLARIDTVEARIAIQDRFIALQSAQLEYLQAKLAFEVHLWGDDGSPSSLQDGVVPVFEAVKTSVQSTEQLLTLANQKHPEILKVQAKLDQLEVDRRLSIENLKPTINLKYNFLTGSNGPTSDQTFSQHNYKLGVQAFFPLYFRKERGKLGLTKVKLSQGQLELVQQRLHLR
jgi:outer membrane protein TolC